MNIKFSYLYRDSGNYKNFKELIFANPIGLSILDLEKLIKSKLIDGMWFYAKDWGLPELHFEDWDDDLDHGFHEFESLFYCEELENSPISLEIFYKMVNELGSLEITKS